jgi:hypothetical protein
MGGTITKKEVLRHSILIIHQFGIRVYFRALFRNHKTFLEILNHK